MLWFNDAISVSTVGVLVVQSALIATQFARRKRRETSADMKRGLPVELTDQAASTVTSTGLPDESIC
jgi:hypothetical protein